MNGKTVDTTLEIQSTQRRAGIQLKLNELQGNNKRRGMKFSGIKDKAVQQWSNNKKLNYRLAAQQLEATEKDLCH